MTLAWWDAAWSTRFIPGRSRTRAGQAPATSAGSQADLIIWSGWGWTRSGFPRSIHRRWPIWLRCQRLLRFDPLFGTLADMDALIAAAHERGRKIILDYVPNHSSDRHPWLIESRRDRASPKRDWYLWRDGSL